MSEPTGDHRRQARVWAVASIALALVWGFGLASMLAVIAGAPARIELARFQDEDESARRYRLVADAGIGLGMFGIFVAFLWSLDVI
ncbi:MAG: hypothetical protein AAGD18_01650 [Actinomycetota bacterium]